MTNGNDSAHPVVNTEIDYDIDLEKNFDRTYSEGGLTKREYFVAMAMQGLLSDSRVVSDPQDIARASVIMANTLIEALNEESK